MNQHQPSRSVAAARRRRDVGRLPQRHQRPPRQRGARRRGAPRRPQRTGRRRPRRRRDRDELLPVQGRHRHLIKTGRLRRRRPTPSASSSRPTSAAVTSSPSPACRSARTWPTTTRWRTTSPRPAGAGSVIAVVATDAPLLPGQCKALARRVTLGLARTGTAARTPPATSSSRSRPPTPAAFAPGEAVRPADLPSVGQ